MVIKSQPVKAAIRTVLFVALVVGISTTIQLAFTNLTGQQLLTGFMVFIGGVTIYTIYEIFLAQIKYEDKIREIARK